MQPLSLNASKVRGDFSAFVDNVIRKRPQFVSRNRDMFMAISVEHMRPLVEQERLTLTYEVDAETNRFVGTLQPFAFVEEAESLEELKNRLVDQLIEYVQMLLDDFDYYMKAPNIRVQLPLIFHILIQPERQNVLGLIDAHLERT